MRRHIAFVVREGGNKVLSKCLEALRSCAQTLQASREREEEGARAAKKGNPNAKKKTRRNGGTPRSELRVGTQLKGNPPVGPSYSGSIKGATLHYPGRKLSEALIF